MRRRTFVRNAPLTLAGFGISTLANHHLWNSPVGGRKFRVCLNPFSIGVMAGQKAILQMAIDYQFEAIIGIPQELEKMHPEELTRYRQDMHEYNITWGASFLPVEFRKSEEKFRDDLTILPVLAEALANAGLTKTSTWIMPTHADLTYMENFSLHQRRLKKVANLLQHFDIMLGLEYVGPKTLMARDRYPFIGSMKEAAELIDAIDEPNVGYVLDSFHWYCARESVADILTLDADDIVAVDLNDAKAGLLPSEQIDNQRELPGHTGVINLEAFINALVQIDYEGTVRAEPFNQVLNDMADEDALRATSAAMFRTVALAG